MATDCVPNESVTLMFAVFGPAASDVSGRNATVTVQVAPGAKAVRVPDPQLDSRATTAKSAVFVPESVPCVTPDMTTLPVLVSVKPWAGSVKVHASPGQLRVWVGLQ